MEHNSGNNLDDLIGSGSTEPIIVQESSSDKKFLYTLLILLVILFIIAMGIVAFLGSKYFGSNTNSSVVTSKQTAQMPTSNNTTLNSKKDEVAKKAVEVAKESKSDALNELEMLVKEEELKKALSKKDSIKKESKTPKAETAQEKTIQKAVAATGKNLSEEDLAKIAKLVAKELKKSSVVAAKSNSNSNRDTQLVASLQSAQTDTLKSQNVDTANLKDSKANSAKGKKVDTFNKVVISNSGDDELSQLTSEIDSILQSKEVAQKEKSLKYGKELKQEITRREKELRFIVVKKGDTLSSLARKAYGRASAYKKIYAANPDLIKNPDRIFIGMKLRVPVDEEYINKQGN